MDLQKHGLDETPVYNLCLTSPWDSITAPRSLKKNLLNKLNLVSPSLQNILRHYPLTNQPAIEQPTNQNQSVNDPPTNQPDKIAAHRPFIPKYEYLCFYYWN